MTATPQSHPPIRQRSSAARSRGDFFASVRDLGSPELFDFLEQILFLFPDEFQYRLKRVLDTLPREGDNIQRVLEVVRAQWAGLQSDHWIQIAVVGPGQTGKSTLTESLNRGRSQRARSILTIADIQGLDEFLGYGVRSAVPDEISGSDVILLLLDGQYELTDETLEIYERLAALDKTLLVVLSKMDLVEDPGRALKAARRKLGTSVFGLSTYKKETIQRLLKAIVASNPRALYPLTRSFPRFRNTICNGIVTQAAFSAGLVGAIPIPISDSLPLAAIQTAMLLKMARVFGFEVSHGRARELLPIIAAGVLIREGAHRLRLRFPSQAKLIAVSVSGTWTYLLGQAIIAYFEKISERLEMEEVSKDSVSVSGFSPREHRFEP